MELSKISIRYVDCSSVGLIRIRHGLRTSARRPVRSVIDWRSKGHKQMLDLSEGLNLDAMDISEGSEFSLMPKAEIPRQVGIKPPPSEALHIYAGHKGEAMRRVLDSAI